KINTTPCGLRQETLAYKWLYRKLPTSTTHRVSIPNSSIFHSFESFLKHSYMHEKEMCFPQLIVAAVAVVLIGTLASEAASLPPDEAEALNRSAIALGKTDWDFKVDPCSTGQNSPWIITQEVNAVNCNCTFNNNSVCH
ncbi:hypothetical protein RJ639_022814, partial [Escallonia herrerae]